MTLHTPARRLVQTARSSTSPLTHGPSLHLRYLLPQTQRRHASWFDWLKRSKTKDALAAELTKRDKKTEEAKIFNKMANRTAGDSIFNEEIESAEKSNKELVGAADTTGVGGYGFSGAKEHMARALDPDPRWRVKWQRKMVMQMVRNAGKPLSKEQRIRLSEKESSFMSEAMPTSVKKLMHLSRQIAGKSVDDAIIQMKYSKKKTGSDLMYYLQEARDKAIVNRGMGLGKVTGEVLSKPKKIQTKDGKWMEIDDPTELYIDQAWVGKGPWRGYRLQYHSRGRMSTMWKPSTYISFVLKEEKTRLRKYDEKLEKQANKKPWVHLPNRPITSQRQYYSW